MSSNRDEEKKEQAGVLQTMQDLHRHEHHVASAENYIRMMDDYEVQLTNISTNATLLLGFVMALISQETLDPLLDGTSFYCMYKSAAHQAVGYLLFLVSQSCICACLVVILFSMQLVARARKGYLQDGWSCARAYTRTHIRFIYSWFVAALVLFLCTSLMLVWLFAGLRHYVDAPDPTQDDLDLDIDFDGLLVMQSGRRMMPCIDPTFDDDLDLRERTGLYVSLLTTAIYAVFCVFCVYKYWSWDISYEMTLDKQRFAFMLIEWMKENRERAAQAEAKQQENAAALGELEPWTLEPWKREATRKFCGCICEEWLADLSKGARHGCHGRVTCNKWPCAAIDGIDRKGDAEFAKAYDGFCSAVLRAEASLEEKEGWLGGLRARLAIHRDENRK